MTIRRCTVMCLALLLALCMARGAQHTLNTGKIVGLVIQQSNHQPVVGANVVVVGTPFGCSAGVDGRWSISGIPVGSYSITISCIGYKPARVADVVVGTGRPVQVAVQLEEASIVLGSDVVATGSFFSQPREVTTSIYGMNYEEIRRAPGALGDVHRMIQTMPGVVPTNDQRNDLVVRGGSPSENLTIIDNIEIPNLSHFGTQGAGGGPISMLNTEFIREANFLAGGFPAQYGGRLSSALNVVLREGDRENITGDVDLSFAGAGGILEGPLGSGGSWMVAARRSFLDLIIGNYGLTAVPHYSNYQAKATYDIDPGNKLWLVSIGGIDWIDFSYDDNSYQNYSTMNIHSGGWRTITGINWQMLWGDRGYGVLSLADALDVFEQEAHDVALQNQLVFSNRSREGGTTLKYDAVYSLEKIGQLTAGLSGRILRNTFDIQQPIGVRDIWSTSVPRIDTLMLLREQHLGQASAYAQLTRPLGERLSVTAGVRYDYFGYAPDAWTISPRVGASFSVTPDISLNASFGMFRQAPAMVLIESLPGNERLKPIRADHYVAGLSWIPAPDVKITLEGYVKEYSAYPVSRDHPTFSLANAGDAYSISGYLLPLVSSGSGESKGVEFYLQKKLTDRLYGQFSYSYSRTRHKALDGIMRPGSFDIPHVLSLVGGFKASDDWEFSAKFTYASGRPYTPLDRAASALLNRMIFDFSMTNAVRMSDYHRLDIRADYRAHFSAWSLVTYVELQNVYNRKNVFQYVWDEKTGRQVTINQIAFFPVGGIRIEF